MLDVYLCGLIAMALIVGFIGPEDGPLAAFLTAILWPIFVLFVIGALIRDLVDTLRYRHRRR